MPSLLSIPPELRNQILHSVVTGPCAAPQDDSHPEKRKDTREYGYEGFRSGGNIMYEKHWQNRAEMIPTLLVNRQLHKETLESITRLPLPEKHSYKLDIMLINESQLWLTWLSVLDYTRRVESLALTIRILPARIKDVEPHYHAKNVRFRDLDYHGPDPVAWGFYFLLEHFLETGPPVLEKERILNRENDTDGLLEHLPSRRPVLATENEVSIKNLELNISSTYVSRSSVKPQAYDDSEPYPARHEDDAICYFIKPKVLVEWMISYFESLLYLSAKTAKYGRILFERIGKIRITLDGELYAEIDLAERLEKAFFNGGFWEWGYLLREHGFKVWKFETRKKRRDLGLSVHPYVDRDGNGEKRQQADVRGQEYWQIGW